MKNILLTLIICLVSIGGFATTYNDPSGTITIYGDILNDEESHNINISGATEIKLKVTFNLSCSNDGNHYSAPFVVASDPGSGFEYMDHYLDYVNSFDEIYVYNVSLGNNVSLDYYYDGSSQSSCQITIEYSSDVISGEGAVTNGTWLFGENNGFLYLNKKAGTATLDPENGFSFSDVSSPAFSINDKDHSAPSIDILRGSSIFADDNYADWQLKNNSGVLNINLGKADFNNGNAYSALMLHYNGNVGIGTTESDLSSNSYKLAVAGTIGATEIVIEDPLGGADFVFEEDYELPTLSEVEEFVKKNKHLPQVPSAKDMTENGINMAEMNKVLLQKVEELTLYLIQLQKEVDMLQAKQ